VAQIINNYEQQKIPCDFIVKEAENPGMRKYKMPSAHLPIIEEKEKYKELLVNVVLKESRLQ
jgi:hypothetical protein